MAHPPQSSDQAQFIAVPKRSGSSATSNPLVELRRIAASRQITVVRVVGPDENPARLIVRASRAAIAELREQFAHELLFDEDLPLDPL